MVASSQCRKEGGGKNQRKGDVLMLNSNDLIELAPRSLICGSRRMTTRK